MSRNKASRRSTMVHDFSKIPAADIPRSSFDRSHGYKTTIDAGPLIPIFLQEVVPGDTHSVNGSIFCRLATPIHPYMDSLWVDTFYFFVPNRLVWDNWQKFMGEQDNPGDSTDFTVPYVAIGALGGAAEGSLSDYFGIPVGSSQNINHSVLPYRGYNLVYNQWFRSEDLTDSLPINTGNGPDSIGDYNLVSRAKRHDYFTSCLPWPQKGPGVDLPLGTTAPVLGIGVDQAENLSGGPILVKESDGTTENWDDHFVAGKTLIEANEPTGPGVYYPSVVADLSNATAATINDLRQAFQIQKLQERDARGGTRYQELILSHFGVRGGDARLQRTEYLGGGTAPVGVTQVPQTAETAATPQGNLAAYATSTGSSGFTKSFTEHGYIIGLINVRADLTYQKGLDRHWSRSTKYDFYWPALAKIGEQAVNNIELYCQDGANAGDNDLVFGYQERWSEMRYGISKITGKFRSSAAASLDPWHLSEDFGTLPVLGDTFITSNPPVDRIVAVQSEPQFLVDCWFKYTNARPMPVNSAPGYIDHF